MEEVGGGGRKELFYKFSWILGKNHQWILKPLGDKLMGNYKMEGSDFLHLSPLVSPAVSKRRIIRQFRSVAQSCPTLHDPMDHSTPGLPVHHQLLEFTQAHVHRVGDATQPLSSPSPPTFNLSQHQGLFK